MDSMRTLVVRRSAYLLLVGLLTLASSCQRDYTRRERSESTVLRISMIPSTDPGKIIRDSQPLIRYLENEMRVRVDLTVPTNYAAVVEAIANDRVDIAYFGGFTYVQASKRAGVVPLVQRERDRNFHSHFITPPDSGINSLADLKGRSFAFGDVNSTSGHLMPEYFMRQAGVSEQVITKAIYTGGHDATALAVANKKVDAGALDEAIFDRMTKEGKLDPSKVRIFYTTPPYFDYVWAARKGLDPGLMESFKTAFMKLNSADENARPILDLLNATAFVLANDSDYDTLRKAAKDAGLLK